MGRRSQDINFSIFGRVVKKLELTECREEADFGLFFVFFRSFLYIKMCTFVVKIGQNRPPLCTLRVLTV